MTKRRKPSRILIVKNVIKEFGLTEQLFFSNHRLPIIVEARREAIIRLIEDGAYKKEIATLIKRDVSVVNYHLGMRRRPSRKEYYAEKWKRLKADPEKYRLVLGNQRMNGKLARDIKERLKITTIS